jgi:peptidoglycan/LPS O-acetylase OafA/YrhL
MNTTRKSLEYLNLSYRQQYDWIRAIAVFMVFVWHFNHFENGNLAPPESTFPPLSLLLEGHTGVSLFFVLSGFIFGEILIGRKINFAFFYLNRIKRLFPLLFVALFLNFILMTINHLPRSNFGVIDFFIPILLPGNSWSVMIEIQCYLLLPLLVYFYSKNLKYIYVCLIISLLVKIVIYSLLGSIQIVSYYSLLGRIDQFILGFIASRWMIGRKTSFYIFVLFTLFWYFFDSKGGFYNGGIFPSESIVWVFIPFIEGVSYCFLIIFILKFKSCGLTGRFLSHIGKVSYSFYLISGISLFYLANFINSNVFILNSEIRMISAAFINFMILLVPASLSYYFIELPFLRKKFRYVP